MKDVYLSILRDKKTTIADFRDASEKIAEYLAIQTFNLLKTEEIKISTPLMKTKGKRLTGGIVLVPILRAGLALLFPFLKYFKNAKVGFIGQKRDEKTAIAHEYYINIPKVEKNDKIIILDPMLATGGSVTDSIKSLLRLKIKEEQIVCVFLIGAPDGVKILKKCYPKIKFIIAKIDDKLNHKKYILPGLGDFGDRFFGTEIKSKIK